MNFDERSDAMSMTGDATSDAPAVMPNRVFTTSAKFTGRLTAGSLTGVTAGDAICTATAAAAGMNGTHD